MSALLPTNQPQSLALIASLPGDQHPALVYLASLGSDHSRRNMARYLNQTADLLTGGSCDLMTLDWSVLRFQHVQAVR